MPYSKYKIRTDRTLFDTLVYTVQNTQTLKTFGGRLRYLRTVRKATEMQRKVSLSDVSAALKVQSGYAISKSRLSELEGISHNNPLIRPEQIKAISTYYNVNMFWLVFGPVDGLISMEPLRLEKLLQGDTRPEAYKKLRPEYQGMVDDLIAKLWAIQQADARDQGWLSRSNQEYHRDK